MLIDAARTPADLDAMVQRRGGGLPLEQVLGWAQFCGLRIAVVPGVFLPRRRTEFLVREATALGRVATSHLDRVAASPDDGTATRRLIVVDLGCGSGAVAHITSRDPFA